MLGNGKEKCEVGGVSALLHKPREASPAKPLTVKSARRMRLTENLIYVKKHYCVFPKHLTSDTQKIYNLPTTEPVKENAENKIVCPW